MIKTIDTVILALLMTLVIKGIWRGLKKELFSLVTYGISFFVATSQLDNGTRFFQRTLNLHPLLGYFLSYVVVFFVTFLIVRFFIKNIRKMFRGELESGLADSLGGAAFGFCLGMVIVGMFLVLMKPIPVFKPVFARSERSIFIPIAERYFEPVIARFTPDPSEQLPLDQLLSRDTGGLILPDAFKGLLDEDVKAILEQAQSLQSTTDLPQDLPANIRNILPDNPLQEGGDSLQTEQLLKGQSTYRQVLELLDVDTTTAPRESAMELLKRLKKK